MQKKCIRGWEEYMLNIPKQIIDVLDGNKVLIAAIGGGYDIYASIPLYYTLMSWGIECSLSSYSLKTDINNGGIYNYIGFDNTEYAPEKHLGKYLSENFPPYNGRFMVSRKAGVAAMKDYYKQILRMFPVDVIITMDGGVDSLMTGTEQYCGTVMEEFINFAALKNLGVPVIHSCIGMGTEIEEHISNDVVLKKIMDLESYNAFLGSCSLVKDMKCYQFYRDAYLKVHQTSKKVSHIHPRIISAVEGQEIKMPHVGETIMQTSVKQFINPLMSIQWFFDGNKVMSINPFLDQMQSHMTILDTMLMIKGIPRT
jgi:hypothetical protein